MKKIILMLIGLMACLMTEAKVVKITLIDGTVKVFTSSELSSVVILDNGMVRVTTYDGRKFYAGQDSLSPLLDVINIGDQETVFEELDRTLTFTYSGTTYFSRDMHQINYVYPSTDCFGEPITLSGTILIPKNIWEGEDESEGILLFNHYTIFDANEAPTKGYATLEGMFMANPLNLNYIVVESDFYGFGPTVRFPQAYMQGIINGRASCDALLAARRLLDEMGIDYGPLCFNVGYSSGGFDALSTQKARDMEYRDEISFDKTFAGGSPSDIRECYRQYVEIDSTAYNAVPALLMVSTNYVQNLGLTYEDVFQPFLAEKIDEWIMSKKYWSWPVCDSIGREKKIHEFLTEPYCNLRSDESRAIQDVFRKLSIATDWTPDPTQRIYLMHSRGDDYVPVQSARPLIDFLKSNGFTASIIPGKTNLQTNFLVRDMGHLKATLIYLIQTVAALKAWPAMYTDGQLNPMYDSIINQDLPSLVQIMRYLDSMGIDCRALITELIARISAISGGDDSEGSGSGPDVSLDYFTIMNLLNEVCDKMGLPLSDLQEMLSDSGIDFMSFLIELITYFAEDNSDAAVAKMMQAARQPATPAAQYEDALNQWMHACGIKD